MDTHRQRYPGLAVLRMLFSLSFLALAACTDRDLPTGVSQFQLPGAASAFGPVLNVVGADYVVTTTADAGDGSLRAAMTAANSADAAKTIAFAIPASDAGCSAGTCTIALASTLPVINSTKGVTIDGAGHKVTISGGGTVRIMQINEGGVLVIRNLRIANGGPDNQPGNGVFNFGGTLIVENAKFANNASSIGGAIANFAVPGFGGTTTVRNTTFSGNSASQDIGGAIYSEGGGSVTISNSTFFGNRARLGGAILVLVSSATIENSTFVENSVSGALATGAAIYTVGSPVLLKNTIVAGSTGACSASGGVITDGGYNLEDGATCGFSAANNSKPNTNPLLDPNGLQNNGGPTQTIALQAGSPAINAIPNGTNGCGTTITTDQRGIVRPQGGSCDIGAYEVEVTDATPPVITPQISGTLGNNGWYRSDVTVSWTVTDAESDVTSPACTPTTISADTPGQVVTCNATSAGGSSTKSVTIKRDATPPSLAPVVSPNPVPLGRPATAGPNASDAMSGLASSSCATPVTSSAGNKSVACTATDHAGNTGTATASYSVTSLLGSLINFIENLLTTISANSGTTVPVKFSLGGNHGLGIIAPGYPVSQQVSCTTGEAITGQPTATGTGSLSFDALTKQYGYGWKTDKAWSGTCRTLTIKFTNGTTHVLTYKFK